jgi:iron complex outermembrane receptor protein
MNKFFSLLAATVIVLSTNAQTGKITGGIKDGGNQKTIDAATISLLSAKDSGLIKIAVADKDGNFAFENVKDGQYLILATAVGHNKMYSNVISLTADKLEADAGVLQLLPAEKSMKAVVVNSTKPFIERKLDKTIVNVDASISNVGATAIEVLEKSPGITVDKDGNISLKGKQGVKVFIDGKPSYLSGPDLANMLKSMPAAQLDQIEIMTNPSAKYDAAGNSGVVNIKTKKTKTVGFNGSIASTYIQGQYAKFNESLNFNYRNKNVNLFGNYAYRNSKGFNELVIQRKFRDENSKELLSIFDQEARFNNTNESNNAKLGIDVTLSKKTTIGAVFSGYLNTEKFDNFNNTFLKDKEGVMSSRTYTTTDMKNRWNNFNGNFNLRHVFDSTGKELTVDLDYINYGSTNRQTMANYYFDAGNGEIFPSDTLKGNIPSNITIYSVKADYSQTLKGNIKMEAGIKASFVKTDNNAGYDSLINGKLVKDLGRSNHFVYDEQIQATYVNFNKQLDKKWSTQVGLRLENTIAKGVQLTTNEKFERNYMQLFPTAYIGYELNQKNNLSVNYGRRIERPDYGDLNPFYFFLDKYTYEVGNPNLRPQFSHNVELSHTYAGKITTTLNYTKSTDLINQIFEQNEAAKETFVTKSNIASQQQVGVAVSAFIPVKKWLKLNVYSNLANNRFKGFINNSNVDIQGTVLESNISAQMGLGKGWNAELSGFYRTKGVDGVMIMNSFGALNGGISKSVLKNKGTVKMSFRDILWTQKFKGAAQYSYIDMQFRQVRDSRQASLSFNYSFGKGKASAPKRKIGGASEEQSRVKSGGN